VTAVEAKRGRPRDQAVDQAVMEAVLDGLEEVGLASLSMEAIAARAGVGKATIYRRWSSKEDLVIDVVAGLVGAIPVPLDGDIRTSLIEVLKRFRAFMSKMAAGAVFPWLVGEVAAGTEVGRHYAEAVILPRQQALAGVIQAAVDRGELRADLDVKMAVQLLMGPALMQRLLGPFLEQDEQWEENLVDALLRGWVVGPVWPTG